MMYKKIVQDVSGQNNVFLINQLFKSMCGRWHCAFVYSLGSNQ